MSARVRMRVHMAAGMMVLVAAIAAGLGTRYRIVTVATKGMTAHQTPCRQIAAFDRAMELKRL